MGIVKPTPRRWTADEYYRAVEAGIFGPEERLELIDGEIFRMSPQKKPHIVATRLTQTALEEVFQAGWTVFVQASLALETVSVPEPDLVVTRGEARDYLRPDVPIPALVVEVADTTLRFDRGRKAVLYARLSIPEYWILNLRKRTLEVFRSPDSSAERYQEITRYGESDAVSPLAVPRASIAVRDLLP